MTEANAPTGTVTFLFTDIEGSTRLWDQYPDAMSKAMVMHDQTLQRAVDAHEGYVFSRAGDGWGMSFASPMAAIETALAILGDLAARRWPPPIDAIRVRMGLHTGTSVERDGDYFGTTVNRASRVADVGNGGQVLITDAVHALVADEALEHWRFRDLGEHRLQDLARSERMWQIDTTTAPAPIADIGQHTTHGNLPPARTRLFGRDGEMSALATTIRSERLITLVGVGGVGKTSLAQASARLVAADFPAGAWFIDLAPEDAVDGIPDAVASALEISQRPGMTTVESICDALSVERRLVIIDNAEHVIDAVAELVDTILNRVADACVLVTSREGLAVDGEVIHRVLPLATEDPDGRAPAIALFEERARRVAPDVGSDAFDTGQIAEICRRLDGLPLAIELAASQCEVMTPAEILRAIDDHSLTLQSPSRSVAPRHRSLTNLIEWSYRRLDQREQIVFDRLAVFNAGCTADAARIVCSDETVSEEAVAASLRVLMRKSMIIVDRRTGTTRFGMLETLRSFAEERFAASTDVTATSRRHAQWCAELSVAAREGMAGTEESRHLALLLADLGNVQRASRWACAHEEFDLVADLGACLPYLVGSKMRPGMLDWVHDALDVLPPDHPARLNYGFAIAYHALFEGDLHGSTETFSSATAEVADRVTAEVMLSSFELISGFFRGDMDLVMRDSEVAMQHAYDAGLIRVAGALGTDLAMALLYAGDIDGARRLAGDLASEAERSGNPTLIAWARYVGGEIDADTDPAHAVEMLEESVEYAITVDNEFVAGIALIALAATAGRHGDVPLALDAMDRCIHLFWGAGNRPQLWTAVRNLVEILHSMHAYEDALVLHAAAEANAQHAPEVFGPMGDRYRALVESVTGALEPADADTATIHGRSLAYNDAAQFALDAITRNA